MATIEVRGPHQYRVRVRRNGVNLPSRTFETRAEAENYARVMDGKISGRELVEPDRAASTSLRQALEWYEREIVPRTPRSSANKLSVIRAWRESQFVDWKLSALKPWDLIQWRREVLDEDNAEDGETVGPDARFKPQTCIHRLNLLSHLFNQWAILNRVQIANPVIPGVRPQVDGGRERRLGVEQDEDGLDEEARLFKAVARSKSIWLPAMTRIALETCMRQAELVGLTLARVRLDGEHPYADLPKTKNDRPRRVPLSTRAVAAFRSLETTSESKTQGNKVFTIESPRAVGHAFRKVVTEEKFPGLRWHDLRHEAISRLFENTDLRDHEIMAITGHLTPSMLQRYTHLRSHWLASRLG